MKWWMVLVDRLPKLVLPWRTLFPSGQFVRPPQLQGILIITIPINTSSPPYLYSPSSLCSSRTVQYSSCRSKPAGNRFTACLGIFPTTWIPEQEDWRMAKLLFRYCPLKGNPNASPMPPLQMQLFVPRLRTTWGSLSLSFAALVPRRVQLSQGRQPVVDVIW